MLASFILLLPLLAAANSNDDLQMAFEKEMKNFNNIAKGFDITIKSNIPLVKGTGPVTKLSAYQDLVKEIFRIEKRFQLPSNLKVLKLLITKHLDLVTESFSKIAYICNDELPAIKVLNQTLPI